MLSFSTILSLLSLAAIIALAFLLFKKFEKLQDNKDKFQDQNILNLNQRLDSLNQNLTQNLNQVTQNVLSQLSNTTKQLDVRLQANIKDFNERLSDQSRLLQNSHKTVGNRLDNVSKVTQAVTGKLSQLEESSKRILDAGQDMKKLQDILQAPKLRGGFGELMLSRLLEDILPRDHFKLQHTFKNGEIVDAVIIFPERDSMLPIDSKFPLENFKKIIETDEEQTRKQAYTQLKSDIKHHIKIIAQKYIKPAQGTLDIAFMYIPAENVYYQMFVAQFSQAGLTEYAFKHRVIPVSPNSFYSYLQTVLFGLRGLQVEKSAKKIFANIQRLQLDFSRFSNDFRLVGAHLNNAHTKFEDSDKRLIRFTDKLERIEQEGVEQGQIEHNKQLALSKEQPNAF